MAALDPTISGVIYTVGAAFVIAVATAAARTLKKHQSDARDSQALREFFFDTPENPRTGVPAKEGWTTKVDKRQDRMERKLDAVLSEVTPNGGHNMRGAIDRTAKKVDEK